MVRKDDKVLNDIRINQPGRSTITTIVARYVRSYTVMVIITGNQARICFCDGVRYIDKKKKIYVAFMYEFSLSFPLR